MSNSNNLKEIERKFTLVDDSWKQWTYTTIKMDQGYFLGETSPVIFDGYFLKLGDTTMSVESEARKIFAKVTIKNNIEVDVITPTLATVRIRQENEKYFLTIKVHINAQSCYEPDDYELNKDDGKHFLEHTHIRMQKTRYLVGIGNNQTADIDVYEGDNSKMCNTAEVEFDTEADANAFIKPECFDKELTGIKKFSCKSLAREPFNFRKEN